PQLVEVDGVGKLADGDDAARRQALNDALRNAVEKVIGTYVESTTLVDKYELVEDRIMTRANGFAAVREIVKQSREGGALTLTCQVEVMYKPIRDALVAMGIARQWRVMVCIPEQHIRRVVPDPAAENAMMRQLIAAGLPVIDQRQSAELRNNQELLLRIAGNPTLAAQLRAKYNAEVLVTGEAFSQDIDPIAGQAACRARLEIKAIDLNTAEVLAAEDQHSTGTDQTSELAGKVALRKAADEIAERFIDMIYRRPMPSAGMARVEITITGFKGFTAADRFKKNLAKLPGVSAVRQLEFAQGLLKVEVELNHALAENLPVMLESDPSMKEFKIGVQSVTTSTIVGQAGP
ncbi:MAG: flagellar assembly protein T N-terminal domain-containing protein, partial [Fimbriimonadaceae bacterium]|nr:flagellar assembly protein T N-terminal domain-containing protein [Fimbriimonadaceae bacterium]